MAKPTHPLFAIHARGSLAQAITLAEWKGLATAKAYRPPSNPQTAPQQSQRSRYAQAFTDWREEGLTVSDHDAWRLLARLQSPARSGYNSYMQEHMTALLGIHQVELGFNGRFTSAAAGSFRFWIDGVGIAAFAYGQYGAKPTFLPSQFFTAAGPPTWSSGNIAWPSGTYVYVRFYFQDGDGLHGRTGIYRFLVP